MPNQSVKRCFETPGSRPWTCHRRKETTWARNSAL